MFSSLHLFSSPIHAQLGSRSISLPLFPSLFHIEWFCLPFVLEIDNVIVVGGRGAGRVAYANRATGILIFSVVLSETIIASIICNATA